MKLNTAAAWAALVFLMLTMPATAAENAAVFLDGIRAYRSGDYDRAIEAFGALAGNGIANGRLYYNLANAYLKNDDLGNAVLWYEKAMKLIPDDPDLKFNYAYALTLTQDEKGDSAVPLTKIFFFWKYQLSRKTVQYTAIVLNALFWLCLILRLRYKRSLFRTSAYVLLAVALMFIATALYNDYEEIHIRQGVILSPDASVRSGLTDDATELFQLHAGTRVTIEKENSDHYRIFFSEGKIGWIRKSDLGVI